MHALWPEDPRRRFISFVIGNLLFGAILTAACSLFWRGVPVRDLLWLDPFFILAFTLNGAVWGYVFFILGRDHVRR